MKAEMKGKREKKEKKKKVQRIVKRKTNKAERKTGRREITFCTTRHPYICIDKFNIWPMSLSARIRTCSGAPRSKNF